MSIKVYKATEIKFEHLSWLLYGPTGSGKTTLVGTFPGRIAHINFVAEKGVQTLRGHTGVDVIDVFSTADVPEAINYVVKNHEQFRTVAVDSVTTWCELLYREWVAAHGKVEWNQWKDWKSTIFSAIERLRALPLEVVVTAGMAAKDDEVRDITTGGPAVFGSLKTELPSRMEIVIYMEAQTDERGFPRFRAYPSGKGKMMGRVRGTKPTGPIEAPSYKKIVDAIAQPLFKGKSEPESAAAPSEEKKADAAQPKA